MNDQPRQKLCELIARHGTALCDEPGRCEGYLRDYCPQHRREVNVLVTALRERVASDLLGASESMPAEVVLGRLIKRLRDHHGTEEQMARWAVESWALALGKISKEGLRSVLASANETPNVLLPSTALPEQRPVAIATRPPPQTATPAPRPKKETSAWRWAAVGAVILIAAVGRILHDSQKEHLSTFIIAVGCILLLCGFGLWLYQTVKADHVKGLLATFFGVGVMVAVVVVVHEKSPSKDVLPVAIPTASTPSTIAPAPLAALAANDFNTAAIGDTRVVNLGSGVKLTLCYIPAGSFTMGSPAGEAGRLYSEKQVPVKISRAYWLAQTECTQAQWRAVMDTEPSEFKGDDLPVERVRWEDAQEFMTKLNGKNVLPAGWQWSLPTEAQWEHACRAGTTTTFSFGDSLSSQQANFNGNYPYPFPNGDLSGRFLEKTTPVGSYAANAWGLQDMHGNVYEWCRDWYDDLPGGTDPTGAASGSNRVLRGGSWLRIGDCCRSASRYWDVPGIPFRDFGFRAASVPVER